MTGYTPDAFSGFPHERYRCPCGESVIVIGWEVETCICDECGSLMEWGGTLHDPREAGGSP